MAVVEEDFLGRSALNALQGELLRALLTEILPHNRFYARKFAGLSVEEVRTPADLARLPFTTKAELLADQAAAPPYGQAHTYQLTRYCRMHQTSGSTGVPLRWLDTSASWTWMLGCWEKIYRVAGVGPEDRLFFPFSFGPFLGFWTAFEAACRLGCLSIAGGGMSSGARLRSLFQNEATVVLCTPTYAMHLAEVAQEQKMDLTRSGVRKLIVAGEPGGSIPATRRRLEEAWGARVFDHSGMTEVGPCTIECPGSPGGLHLLEGDYIAEVIDPATGDPAAPGQVGELVVTNLGRLGSPLIRYRTGDLVRPAQRTCPCGRSWLLLQGGIVGRTDGLIQVRGNNIYPTALEAVIRGFPEVVEYSICVDQSNSLTEVRIDLEPRHNGASDLAEKVSHAIRDNLLFRAEVRAVPPGSLPRFEMKAQRVKVVPPNGERLRSPQDEGLRGQPMHCVSLRWLVVSAWWTLLPLSACAHDWSGWRGPEQTGVSREKDLPAAFTPLWKAPFGARSTPIVMNGRVYINNQVGEGIKEQERVICFDANSGKVLWEQRFNVFLTDIVSVRLGWTNLAGDPETDRIYWHGTQGDFICFDRDGKIVWQRQLTEQDGRITGYGGRVTSPIVDKDLVIIGMINSSWGDQAKPANRFLAMDKKTGEVRWWSEPSARPATYYSTPVVAVIKGQRLLISGCSDGAVHAMNVYTGAPVWNYPMSQEALNSSPVVHGDRVYMTSGGENIGNNIQGRIVCLDAGTLVDGKPKLVWQKDGINAKYTTPILHDKYFYVCDDIARLYCLDAEKGTQLWKYAYGRNAWGSPVWGDGKIYVGDVNGKFHILEPGPKKCKELKEELFSSKDGADVEIKGNPAIANGKVYFTTSEELYCIGNKDHSAKADPIPPEPAETPLGEPARVQLRPADIMLQPGDKAQIWATVLDKDGRELSKVLAEGTWTLPTPPLPPGAKQGPPPLEAALEANLVANAVKKGDPKDVIGRWRGAAVNIVKEVPSQQGMVVFDAGKLGKASTRVRVAPRLPYIQDFEKFPEGASMGGWVNANGKVSVAIKDGGKVLAKNNTKSSPLVARGNAFIGLPNMSDYTIESDVMGTKKGTFMPDVGVVNSRYTLALWGELQRLRLQSWEAIPRVDAAVNFKWEPGTWYRVKLSVHAEGDKAVARGKVWKRGEAEPKAWTVEFNDPTPNREGAPALYGYITGFVDPEPGNEIYYDNVRVTPNAKGLANQAGR